MCDEKCQEVYFYGKKKEKQWPLISAMTTSRLLCQRCMDVLVPCHWHLGKGKKTKDIPTVCKFGDVFPAELLGLPPPNEKIDYGIN